MLKRTAITSIIFLVFLVMSLGAYTNTSFRNATTAYLLEDDYDFWLGPYPLPDPARLPLLDGARLYTNLSNFINKSEEVFSNSSTDYFLIGGSTTPLFNYANLGLVIDRFNERDPLNTYLYDMQGNAMFGYGHVVHEELYDDDYNGVYDRRIDIEETGEAWHDRGEKDFVFCLGKDFDGWLGGLFFRLNSQSIEEFPYDTMGESGFTRNYTYDYTETSLDSVYTIYTETYLGTGSIKDDFSENQFGLSFWKYLNDTRAVGVHFGYGMISGEILDVTDIAEDWNVNPGDTITDTYSLVVASEGNVPYSGNSMTGWLSYIDDWNEITHLRFDGYYKRRSTDIDSDAHRDYSFVDATNASDGSTESNNNTETVGITGDASSQVMSIAGKVIYDLTDRVTFAFGAGFSMSSMDSSRRESSNYSEIYSYNNGDTIAGTEDYVTTTTYSDSIQGDGSYSTNSIRFPVCVEWHVTKPVVFRLGAIHTISHSDQTLDMDLLGYTAATAITVYGDGTADTTLLDNPKIDDIQTGEDNKTSSKSSTSFTYGMGYAVSENLQIDLMGFSDLTKLYNWRVSATMKFY